MMNNRYIAFSMTFVALVMALVGCSSEQLTEYERTKAAFLDSLGGNVSSMQMWRTAVRLNVSVAADSTACLWLVSAEDNGTLYDFRSVEADTVVTMVAPQGKGNKVYIVGICGNVKRVAAVVLTGKPEESVTVDFSATHITAPLHSEQVVADPVVTKLSKAYGVNNTLYGNSVLGDSHYYELTDEQRNEGFHMLKNYYIEYVNAKDLGLNCNYEFESNGDFDITWYAGNCMSHTPHVFGYYYHSPGTYDDIRYVDISEAEIYDYIDGKAKVQYMVNQNAAERYGIEANQWYDANFDMGDVFNDPHPSLGARAGDNAYNTMAVYNRYGADITAIRGVSFTIKVPKGMRAGVYYRIEDVALPEQYDRLKQLGVVPYTSRDKFKAMNFSCEAMNMNMKGSYRSCVVESEHSYWLGMENDYTGGDLDCNDVIFHISSKLPIYMPDIVVPDVHPTVHVGDMMPWTLAFEDVHRRPDFDFNDAVLRLIPDFDNQVCRVMLMAAGSTERMYLHYDGPDGDQNLGEIHELLGGNASQTINTSSSVAVVPFAELGSVAWPKTYDMQRDASRFYIEVKRGSCHDCSDILQLSDTPSLLPQAVLVAGEWKWPMEGVGITKAYSMFAGWGRDVTNTACWNWYSNPKTNTCVNY